MRDQRVDRDYLECALVCGTENDRRCDAGLMGFEPARGADAPAIATLETGESPFRSRGREVVPGLAAEREELLGHHGAHRVTAEILGAGRAAPVPEEAGDGIARARQQGAADNVAIWVFLHGPTLPVGSSFCVVSGAIGSRRDADPVEIRVLGCLIEKQRTTPDAYPLTLNSLRLACNQTTNREPVVEFDEETIREALQR